MLLKTAPQTASFVVAGGIVDREVRLSTGPAEKSRASSSSSWVRWKQGRAGMAFAFGAAWFAVCAVLVGVSGVSSHVVMGVALAALDVVVVTVLSRALGVGCAMTVGVAGVVALDWYCLPPVHDHGPPDAQNALALGAYLLTGALLGQLAAEARIRATESEGEARVLASEQAALRRVATLVATESDPERVFEAVTHEVGELLSLDVALLLRYESDDRVTVVGGWSRVGPPPIPGARWALTTNGVARRVRETRRRGRVDDVGRQHGSFDLWMHQVGARSSIGSPVEVHGSLWGVMVGASVAAEPLAEGTELRLGEFTELAATAVANADSRNELAASRARVVASSNRARQQIERDLHDGVQQRLVSLALDVHKAEALAAPEQVDLREQLSGLRGGLVSAIDDLREVAQGVHPSILTEGGLRPALARLARRAPIPVELSVRGLDRVPDPIEVCVYYVVSEALTNVLKHADATTMTIDVELDDSAAHLVVRDDGLGGADIRAGSGLVGLIDRVEALGGAMEVCSPADQGTRLGVHIAWASTGADDRSWSRPSPDGTGWVSGWGRCLGEDSSRSTADRGVPGR